jgi:hypothetical protein
MWKLSSDERQFVGQAPLFASAVKRKYSLTRIPDLTARLPYEIPVVDVADYRALTHSEAEALAAQYHSQWGVAHFLARNDDRRDRSEHPLLVIAKQMSELIGCQYPMAHALETHIDPLSGLGPPDGTVKIYAATGKGAARSTGELLAHQDGLGCCGDIDCVGLYMDQPAGSGGRTYFINLALLSAYLGEMEPDAFEALFLPDAITVFRSSGYRGLKITAPICSLYEDGEPQVFFRRDGGEYRVSWRRGNPHLDRAREFLEEYTKPFANGSTFVDLAARGQGCLNDNHLTVHGREAFRDETSLRRRRVLSRKWYSPRPSVSTFKHAPGLRIAPAFATLFPQFFGPDKLEGEWFYDNSSSINKLRDRSHA